MRTSGELLYADGELQNAIPAYDIKKNIYNPYATVNWNFLFLLCVDQSFKNNRNK